jgi:mannose-6-phosphate isomerase-like protein (cupin superfamily)
MHQCIKQNIRALKDKIHEIPLEELTYKSSPQSWSKKEILGHLIDSAVNNLNRFLAILNTYDDYRVHSYLQDYLVKVNRYQEADVIHLINLWQSLNTQIANVLQEVLPKKLEQIVFIHGNVKVTFEWLIQDYIDHMEHHLKQIVESTIQHPMYHISQEQALAELKKVSPKEFVTLVQHGELEIEYYKPDTIDRQLPHNKDEVYIIAGGSGEFVREEERYQIKQSDVLFVKAGEDHRFENFTDDFATWVIFYGMKR